MYRNSRRIVYYGTLVFTFQDDRAVDLVTDKRLGKMSVKCKVLCLFTEQPTAVSTSLSLDNKEYVPALADPSSMEFQALAMEFETEVCTETVYIVFSNKFQHRC